MIVKQTKFDGLLIIEPSVFKDDRGIFYESHNNKSFTEHGLHYVFVQDNESRSQKGVIRGFHYQLAPFAQAKLVRVIKGSVQDVVIDLRTDSKTFGKSFSTILSEENKQQLLIPRGFAHAFLSLEDDSIFVYKCDNFYNKAAERGININDTSIFDEWELNRAEFIISEKDQALASYEDAIKF